jgi:hypothetical protein
MKIPIVNP